MSLRFSYVPYTSPKPIVSLGGRTARSRPIIGVAAIGPQGSWALDALLDTGSDDTLFPEDIAALIGIDLTGAPQGTVGAMGRGILLARYAEVTLRVADNQERRERRAWVGFIPVVRRYALLGHAGFLQYFTAAFHGDREEVKLTVNGLYPGT